MSPAAPRRGTGLALLAGWTLVLVGALVLLLVATGCGADPGYYYDDGGTVIVHQHTTVHQHVTHVHVYPRPRAVPPVVRPYRGGRR